MDSPRDPFHRELRRICIRRLLAIPARESCNSQHSLREFHDLYCRCSAKRVVRVTLLIQGQPVFSAHAPKGPESRSNAAFGFPEPVLAALEIRYKLTVLNANHRLEVQAPHDRHEIQIVCLTKPTGTEPMIAVVSGPVVSAAERYC